MGHALREMFQMAMSFMETPELPERRRKPFTLLELLVVIAIMAVLASLLFPTLSKVMAQAKTVQCAGQLKQTGNALLLYTGDNRGIFPVALDWATQGLRDYITGKNRMQTFLCPQRHQNKSYPYGTMGYNQRLHSMPWFPPIHISRITKPGMKIMALDGNGGNAATFTYDAISFATFPQMGQDVGEPWNDMIRAWHSNGTNCLFVDGHVEWIQLRPSMSSLAQLP